jgi:hypothetical protein
MTSRRAADDRSGRGTPCRALTNWSVAGSEDTRTQNNARRKYNNFPFHDANPFAQLNCAGRRMLRGQSQHSLCLTELVLRIYKYFLCTYVQDQPAVRNNLRAVILLKWRIWARYNARRIMRVTAPRRIVASLWGVFLLSIYFRDRCRCHHRVDRAGINPLRVQSRAQHKQPSYNR